MVSVNWLAVDVDDEAESSLDVGGVAIEDPAVRPARFESERDLVVLPNLG